MRVCFVSNFKVLAVLNKQRSCEHVNCLLVCKQNASVFMRYISTLEYCLFSCLCPRVILEEVQCWMFVEIGRLFLRSPLSFCFHGVFCSGILILLLPHCISLFFII